MKLRFLSCVLLAIALLLPSAARAQTPASIGAEMLGHFGESMNKFIALAEAMPADKFTWSPGTGVMPVGQVYMHVARYNYGYVSENMGAALPAGVKLDAMESVRDKAAVVQALRESAAFVRANAGKMSAADLAKNTQLYGREVQNWQVLVQLVAHMNEHLGQSIAYARMNGIVPPWSR